jgi:hypothetical protein
VDRLIATMAALLAPAADPGGGGSARVTALTTASHWREKRDLVSRCGSIAIALRSAAKRSGYGRSTPFVLLFMLAIALVLVLAPLSIAAAVVAPAAPQTYANGTAYQQRLAVGYYHTCALATSANAQC